MTEKAARKIIAGLEDALAFAKGDETRASVTTLSPKPSLIERLHRKAWDMAREHGRADVCSFDELPAPWHDAAAYIIGIQLRELAAILREMPEELVDAIAAATVKKEGRAFCKAPVRAVADWLDQQAEPQ